MGLGRSGRIGHLWRQDELLTFIDQIGVTTMTASTDISPPGAVSDLDEAKAGIGHAAKSLAAKVTAWIDTCADYYAAAAIYEQLSRLSNSELSRRGLSRATLASDIARMCDRTND
jgi:hypothetical protein